MRKLIALTFGIAIGLLTIGCCGGVSQNSLAQEADTVSPDDLSKLLNNDYEVVTTMSRSYSDRLQSAEKIIGLVAELRDAIGKAAIEERRENIQQKISKAFDQTDPLLNGLKEAKAAIVIANGRVAGILALLRSAKEEIGYLKEADVNENNHYDIFWLALVRLILIIDASRLEANYTASESHLSNDKHLNRLSDTCNNVKKALDEVNVVAKQSNAHLGDTVNKLLAKTSDLHDTVKSIMAADKDKIPEPPSALLRQYCKERSAIMLPKTQDRWEEAAKILERVRREAEIAGAKLASAKNDFLSEITSTFTAHTYSSRFGSASHSGTVTSRARTKEQIENEQRARANNEAVQYQLKQVQADEYWKRQELDIEKILASPTTQNAVLASVKIKDVLQPVANKMAKNSPEYKAINSLLQKMDRAIKEYVANDAEARKLLKTVSKSSVSSNRNEPEERRFGSTSSGNIKTTTKTKKK